MASRSATAGVCEGDAADSSLRQEVRVAMALNGGVSLAVWMGGCAVELDRARRAHIADEESGSVYEALCKCFGRRLVLDILTGASAGGINGALLGAAMANGRKLDATFLRDSWLDLGSLSDLLYSPTKEDPPALLDGDLFHRRLEETFEAVLGPCGGGRGPDPCATSTGVRDTRPPSLDVTMTDVVGVEKRFTDAWGGELVAREHRPRFKFREASHFEAGPLAAAARASASFPVAFAPWPVSGAPRVLADLPNPTYGIDGGLLDNAPIEAALDLISTKPAGSHVLRYVCYVNGDPALPSDELAGRAPGLREVGGYLVNLPRTAPFVDQLYAIKRAVERPRLAEKVQSQLLTMEIEQLSGVAGALFDAYAERRTRESLEELLGDPGAATAMSLLLERTGGRLPWIPFGPAELPSGRRGWRWGIRPAQRVLHLLLDLIRPQLPGSAGEAREALLAARNTIDGYLALLGETREGLLRPASHSDPARLHEEDPLDRLQRAAARAGELAPQVFEAVQLSADAFHSLVRRHSDLFEEDLAEALFGAPRADDWLAVFLRRTLAIEVVRRAFSTEAEIESAEELRFVQLTPAAPSPIFTSGPLGQASPSSAAEKLTGVGFGHFAGFFRRSWRANDFMWGRLDASARIVDLLLDRPSDEFGVGTDAPAEDRAAARAECLVEALLPASAPEGLKPDLSARRWLLRELLSEAAARDGTPLSLASEEELGPLVKERIEAELKAAGSEPGTERMPFTRAAFQRAAQLEIVAEELGVIHDETSADSALGSAVKPFPAEKGASLEKRVREVRDLYDERSSLPRRLTDEEEAVSDLGLRTIAHVAFVALSAARGAGAPLAKLFGVVRTPLSAIAASVARGAPARIAVGAGFWGAAIYLTARLVSAPSDAPLSVAAAWSWANLTALVAALGAAGLATVPVLRLWRSVHPLRNFLLAVGLLGAAYGFAAALAIAFGGFDLERVVFAPGATAPPNLVLLAPLFVLGVVSAARLPIPGWLGPLSGTIEALRTGRFAVVLAVAAFGLVGVWAGIELVGEGFDGGALWQGAAAAIALAGAPAMAALSLVRWPRRTARPADG